MIFAVGLLSIFASTAQAQAQVEEKAPTITGDDVSNKTMKQLLSEAQFDSKTFAINIVQDTQWMFKDVMEALLVEDTDTNGYGQKVFQECFKDSTKQICELKFGKKINDGTKNYNAFFTFKTLNILGYEDVFGKDPSTHTLKDTEIGYLELFLLEDAPDKKEIFYFMWTIEGDREKKVTMKEVDDSNGFNWRDAVVKTLTQTNPSLLQLKELDVTQHGTSGDGKDDERKQERRRRVSN